MKQIGMGFLLLAVLLTACETDFEVNATWEETTIVYGLLDQSVDTQEIIIYKAFLGEESAYVMAQEADSIFYAEEELEVFLFGLKGTDTLQNISLDYTLAEGREEGIFSTDYSVVYTTTEQLDASLKYHLWIHNVKTGHIVTSHTNLVQPLDINAGFTNEVTFYKNGEYRDYRLRWESSKHGLIYQPALRFYYHEKNVNSGEVVRKHIDWSYPQMYVESNNGNEDMEAVFSGQSFYYFVLNGLEESSSLHRINAKELEDGFPESDFWTGGIDFLFVVGGEEVAQYIEINNLPNLVFQDPPTYTNIENGVGIFSSRLHASQEGKELDFLSLKELAEGDLTEDLNFLHP